MAEEVPIPGASTPAKIRGVVAVPLLTLITIGIYGFVWYYKINREMVDFGRASGHSDELGDSPGKSLLAITLGALIIVPALVSYWRTFQRIQATQRIAGDEGRINGWIGILLYVVISIVLLGYMQSGLNGAWRAFRGTEAVTATATVDG
jgi:hypothetical protein